MQKERPSTRCFITDKAIYEGDLARFSYAFDAFVSEAGEKLIRDAYNKGELIPLSEWGIIHNEWMREEARLNELLK